jgi:hypothetical protein|tara:strand:- start:382 stop:621 length:240 start_codon:yes stop_codon:yes gene_type:complete
MATIDQLRTDLINKISAISNKDFLDALDKIITNSISSAPSSLTDSQKKMLKMSQEDFDNGLTISQDAMMKRNLEWLNGK